MCIRTSLIDWTNTAKMCTGINFAYFAFLNKTKSREERTYRVSCNQINWECFAHFANAIYGFDTVAFEAVNMIQWPHNCRFYVLQRDLIFTSCPYLSACVLPSKLIKISIPVNGISSSLFVRSLLFSSLLLSLYFRNVKNIILICMSSVHYINCESFQNIFR